MRLRFAAVFPLCALAALQAYGEQTFPYTAYVAAEDVYVRSGPGTNYYPTGKLHTGDQVEVYRHDPGGWYAVRPVEGSFAWVSGRYLEVGEDGLATVTGDRVAARVGSQFSEIRDVIQVWLNRGEIVDVLGQQQFGSEPGSGTWYKVAPPSGEFRWVFGKYVDPNYLQSGVRKAPAEESPMLARRPAPTDQAATSPERPASPEKDAAADLRGPSLGPPGEVVRTAEHWSATAAGAPGRPEPVAADASSSGVPSSGVVTAERVQTEPPTLDTGQSAEPEPGAARAPAMRELTPEQFQAEVDDVDMELSIMLAEEPTVWKFDELSLRARGLVPQAETAVQRGRARLLVTKIEQSEDIRRRYNAVNEAYLLTERRNRQLAEVSRTRDALASPLGSLHRYDGVGRLVRVVPLKPEAPRYALVDPQGDVRCYVSPAPGVNMNYYLGQQVGINGIRGYLAEQQARHVTAKHVATLDDRRLR